MSLITCAIKMEWTSKTVMAHYKVVPLSDTYCLTYNSFTYSGAAKACEHVCVCVVKVISCRETCLFQAGRDLSLLLLTTRGEGVQAARQVAVEQGVGGWEDF